MKNTTKDLSLAWQICLMVMLSVVVIMLPRSTEQPNSSRQDVAVLECAAVSAAAVCSHPSDTLLQQVRIVAMLVECIMFNKVIIAQQMSHITSV